MKKRIDSEIRRLILEICLVLIFTIVSIPLWDYVDNSTYAEVAEHYVTESKSNVTITNSRKYIYSETFEEAITEMNTALITSYEEEAKEHDIYLALKIGTNYDNIMFSDGSKIIALKDLYDNTSDYIYFKIDNRVLNPNETLTYNYYIWTKNIEVNKNTKIKFAVL